MGMQYFDHYDSVPDHIRSKIRKSVFPPTAEEIAWMNLGE
jgi:hypothetical protein